MRLGRLPLRIVLSAIVAALAAMLLSGVISSVAMKASFHSAVGGMITADDTAQCDLAPSAWQFDGGRHIQVHAYDEAGRAHRADAPRLPDIAFALSMGESTFAEKGIMVARRGDGDCALFRVEFPPPPPGSHRTWRVATLLSVGLSIFLVAGLAFTFAVRPIVQRIQRLRDAARIVGSPDYRPVPDTAGDALTEIGRVLDASNARIAADRDELLRRQEALEVHLAEIAHDLRTPLASMQLALEELVNEASDRDVAKRAMADAVYVTTLVENLHEATRLRHGLDPTQGIVDLGTIVERIGERFTAVGRHRDISVAAAWPDAALKVACQPSFAERLVGNLVHNAIVHGNEGGNVAVVLERTKTGFRLVVEDDGPGLRSLTPADLSARTFRDDDARTRSDGLGIAIVNEVARRVGWTVTYGSGEVGMRVVVEGPVIPT